MNTAKEERKDDVEHFKRQLRDVPWHSGKIRMLNDDIEYAEHELTGLARHSIPMTKEQEKSSLPLPKYQGGGMSLTERIHNIDELKDERDEHVKRIMECRAIEWLAWEQQQILIRAFILRENIYDLAADLNISYSALRRRIDGLIESIL